MADDEDASNAPADHHEASAAACSAPIWPSPPGAGHQGPAWTFLAIVGILTIGSLGLLYIEQVTVKLLPFDNKAEVAIVADLPRGTSVEETNRVLRAAVERVKDIPEIKSFETYAGTASPFNFNGLVRHYYMRAKPYKGDVQVNLTPKGERSRASHQMALEIRERLRARRAGAASLKVVEPPPGPPVLSTLLAEIYGPDADTRRAVAAKVRKAFESASFIVDVDDSYRHADAAQAHQDRPGLSRILRGRSRATCTTRCAGSMARTCRLFASRRWAPADADRLALAKNAAAQRGALTMPVPANAFPGNAPSSNSAMSSMCATNCRPSRSSAITAARPKWCRPNSPAPTRHRSTACRR